MSKLSLSVNTSWHLEPSSVNEPNSAAQIVVLVDVVVVVVSVVVVAVVVVEIVVVAVVVILVVFPVDESYSVVA